MRSLLCLSLLLLATIGRISCDSEASVRLQSIVPTIDSSEPAKDGDAAANPSRTPEDHSTSIIISSSSSNNWTTLTESLDIFSARNLARNWQEGKFPVNQECERDITRYIEGLRRQELWALKGELTFFLFSKYARFHRNEDHHT